MRRYVLTGAPAAGKTSILRGLGALGHTTVEEAATALILRAQQRGRALAALVFEEIHEASYRAFGFELIDVPADDLTRRVAAVRSAIARFAGGGAGLG